MNTHKPAERYTRWGFLLDPQGMRRSAPANALRAAGSPGGSDAELRRRAEEGFQTRERTPQSAIRNPQSAPDTQRLVHELQVHQIELEMQNEELRQARAQLCAHVAQYIDLFEFAPTGYLTLDREGVIRQANLAAARLFGVERSLLLKRRFGLFVAEGDRGAFSDFLQRVFASQAKECCEVTLPQAGHHPLSVRIEGTRSADGQECLAVVVDLTERQRAEAALRESESRFRTIFDSVSGGMFLVDLATRKFETCNTMCSKMLGYTKEDFARLNISDLHPAEDLPFISDQLGSFAQGKLGARNDIRFRRKDGTVFFTDLSPALVTLAGREFILIAFSDITERKRAEEEREEILRWQQGINMVQQSLLAPAPLEDKLRSITDSIVRLFGADFCRIWLIRPGDLCEHGCVHAGAQDGPHVCRYRDRCLHLLASSGRYTHIDGKAHRRVPFGAYKIGRIASGEDHKFLTNDVTSDPLVHNHEGARELGLVSFAGYQLRIPGEGTLGVLALFAKHPILPAEDALLDGLSSALAQAIQQAQAEAALREASQFNRQIVASAQEGIVVYDPDLRYQIWNPYMERLTGLSSAQVLGKPADEVFPFLAESRIAASRATALAGEQPTTIEFEYRVPQADRSGWVADQMGPLRDTQGKVIGVIALVRDITERKRAEESQARLATAVEQAAEAVVITGANGTILYVNPAFEKTSGYTRQEAIGENPRMLKSGKHDAEFYRRMWAVLARGEVWKGHLTNKRKDGTAYEEDLTISPVRDAAGKIVNYVAVKRDVTEQKKLEAQMLRTQRLESIGTLAGGVAHDLNNALAPILMASELLRLEFPDTAASYLDLIQAGAKRGADMVKQLLTFAKGVEGERLLLQPRHLLKEIEKLIKSTFPKNIELRTSYAKDLRTILGDATQLDQVLLNLCVNARDAMPSGGTLTLAAENVEIDATYAREVPEAKPGHYVVWRVTDTGAGIPPEILDRIFEPFFTTKGLDKGTGLGLSTVIGIVKSHGGFVQVYSAPGQGSTFAVYLPAYGADAGDTFLLDKVATTFRGNGETILVVDDEAAVREVMRKVLTGLNFKVLTVANGTEALLQVAERRAELRLVITDLHMPRMDGLSFVRILKGRMPGVGIIVISGRLDEPAETEFKALGVSALLEKPFSQAKLVEALKTTFQK